MRAVVDFDQAGALGLVGAAKYIGDERVSGAASVITAGETMVAIALGVLIGSWLGGSLTPDAQRYGAASEGRRRS